IAEYHEDPDLSCEGSQATVMDWPRLRQAFRPEADWYHEAKYLVYSRSFQANWLASMEECAYGFAMVSLYKLVICAETQAECVNQYAVLIDNLFRERDWREVVGNAWHLFGFLDRVRPALKRHEFRLDFTPAELQGQLPSLELLLDGESPPEEFQGVKLSPSFAGAVSSVLASPDGFAFLPVRDGTKYQAAKQGYGLLNKSPGPQGLKNRNMTAERMAFG
ncbi:unnamed protein product, partial [Symbiodinium sp. KB8]